VADEDRQHLEDLRLRHQRRLRELERQAATFGASAPPQVRIEIEDIQAEIARIDAALGRLRAADDTSQPALPRPARHNLPAQMTTLIGREHEVALVCTLLRRPGVRLVTLTGPGGAGKTRLGLQVASAMFDDFPDGVFFVALAPITEPSLVVPTIAQALGLRTGERHQPVDDLKAFLRERQILLLIDNFEHVLGAGAQISELLANAPALKVLVTSRILLSVYGEREYAVPPLSLPDPRQLPRPEQLTQYEAVRLFIERALSVKPNFAITNENAPAVAQICARLDGLPLAIELAAARIKFLPPQTLLEKLEHRLQVIVGGARDLPARQQTLRGAIDWSYDLLDADERILFNRLAVFVGGATVAAAEAICNTTGDLRIDLAGGIESLVNKSLLHAVDSADGEPRFAMLETIREYALERLEESGQAAAVRDRHLAFFLAFMDTIKRESPAGSDWRHRLDLEHDNLRTALVWSHTALAENVTELQLANALAPFWMTRGYYQEGQHWLEQALARHTEAPPLLHANVQHQTGTMAFMQGQYSAARAHFEASLALYRAEGAKRGSANALRSLAWIDYFQGNHAAARRLVDEALLLDRETESKLGVADALTLLGRMEARKGNQDVARAHFEESLALRWGSGNESAIADALNNLGDLARDREDYATASALYEESLVIERRLGYKNGLAGVLGRLGIVSVRRGELARAMQLLAESLSLFREIGARRSIAWVLTALGSAAEAQGDYQAAREYYEQSRDLFHNVGERGSFANQLRALGDVCAAQRDSAAAERYYQESLTIRRAMDSKPGIAHTLCCLGKLAFDEQAYGHAIVYFEESLAIAREAGDRYHTARALNGLGRAVSRQRDFSRAGLLYEESLAITRELDRLSIIDAALLGLADLALARSDPIRAARLLAAAERIREEKSAHHWPADRPEYDALVGAVRAALGEESFEQAWAEGRALTIEQVVAAGLSGDPPS
jgi:predicted ATPase